MSSFGTNLKADSRRGSRPGSFANQARARRLRMGNEIDAADKQGNQQVQPGVGQQRECPAPFKWVSVAVGNESDERVGGADEIGRRSGAFSQEIVDEQGDRQPK